MSPIGELFALAMVIALMAVGLVCAVAELARSVDSVSIETRLRDQRTQDTYDMFAGYFAAERLPEPVVRAVYDAFADTIFLRKRFPVRPTDPLDGVYGVGDGAAVDQDLFLRRIAASLGVDIVPSSLKRRPVSVEDVVRVMAEEYAANSEAMNRTTLLRAAEPVDADRLLRAPSAFSTDNDTLVRPARELPR